MIDTLAIISYGGAVVFQKSTHETQRRKAIDHLIGDVLLEDRAGAREHVFEDCKLRWVMSNEAKLFAVAVYPKFVASHYTEAFLKDVLATFVEKFPKTQQTADMFGGGFEFEAEYAEMLAKLEASEGGTGSGGGLARSAPEPDEGEAVMDGEEAEGDDKDDDDDAAGERGAGQGPVGSAARREGDALVTKSGKKLVGRRKGQNAAGGPPGAGGPAPAAAATAGGKRKGKPGAYNTNVVLDPEVEKQMKSKGATEAELQSQAEIQRATYIKRLPGGAAAPVNEKVWEGQQRGRVATWLRGFVGTREVDEQDLKLIIPKLREKLIGKNVAVEVAEHVCSSVEVSITGKKLGTFDSLQQTVEAAMVSSLRRILQPKREVNILRDIASARARQKPYSIVLCGVNGVGKSTSLAKIAYWLLQNGNSILIAAGDTFRHGAVEQLEVHGRCLGVPVFQMGYGTDPSAVTAAAVAQASRQHTDVVMVDTAGRMQDHESRMRALAKLIHDNQPDLVLFVGEALVGNTGVDQLRRFNECLRDYSPVGAAARGIDGIVLTKFDTIDDKVGAALSMVYELGQPIVFVGVGQTYQDLKVIEPDVVVSALMK